MKVKQLVGMALLACLGFSATSQAAPLLTATPERATAGERVANAAIANAVVRSVNANDLNYLNTCMRDLRLPAGAYERLFRVVALPRLRNGQMWYFVRPAVNPYCQAFYGASGYGANGFRHWLVSAIGVAGRAGNAAVGGAAGSAASGARGGAAGSVAYQVRYASGLASTFRVLNTQSNGYYDIASSNCTAADCFTTTMKYVGNRYVPFQCSEVRFSGGSGSDVETIVPCRAR